MAYQSSLFESIGLMNSKGFCISVTRIDVKRSDWSVLIAMHSIVNYLPTRIKQAESSTMMMVNVEKISRGILQVEQG